MSAKKFVSDGSFEQPVTVEARQARLELSADTVVIHKSGIEFRSPTPFNPWTEMTVALQSPAATASRIQCSGVVIACSGNKHAGYHVSMVFTGLSKQAQTRLNSMATRIWARVECKIFIAFRNFCITSVIATEVIFFHAEGLKSFATNVMKILLTTTSFQDTPGAHHDLLAKTGWEIIRARGPLNEADTLALVGDAEGYICGDDAITRKVLEKARPKLKVISKYGIGVDKIDVKSCTEFGIPVLFTPGVNHTTVAEHTFLLLLALEKNFLFHTDSTRSGGWKRKTGHELLEKTIGIIGLGRIGKEVAIRAALSA